jgi:ubiquilin
VLKDEQTLNSYGLQSEHTVHLVRGAPPSSTPASANPAPTSNPTSASPPANPGGSGSVPGLGGLGFPGLGLGSSGGASPPFGMGPSEFQQVQQQLMQNPNLMREMMNMPAVQNLMNNPDLMRTLIMSNPQMREIIERNPDLAHILNDPGTLRQTLDAARNPELMREMMRNTDRAMSNIEASPEGFNMLRRMYETVQEPLLNAATMGGEGANDMASNPFAAMMGVNGNPPRPAQAQGGANTNAAGTTLPNTAPLPNPWNPTHSAVLPAAGTGAGQTPSAVSGADAGGVLPDLAGLGLPDLGMMGGAGGLLDPAMMQQMLQNPQIQQMMQGLLSNPQYMNQIFNLQPQLRNMLNQNPQFRDMMQNPDFIRQMSSPESLQQMMQLQQAMMGLRGRQTPGQNAGQTPAGLGELGGLGGLGGGMNMDALLNMFGGLGNTVPSNPDVPPEQLYASQLSQLQEMGFYDTQENIRALSAVGGNVHAAVERLLGN